jgi:hypothetical protein
MLSHVLPEQPGHQLDWLIQVPRMAIDGLWADSRHDVLTLRWCRALAHGMDLPRCSVPG